MSEPASNVEVQPAATVMLVRDASGSGGGPLEVLMLRRHPESVFAADAWVFPGGRVDDGDRAGTPIASGPSDAEASATLSLPSGGLAYWVAAARECFEEAGILLARRPDTGAWLDASSQWSAARLARYRRDVHSGARTLGALLEAEGLVRRIPSPTDRRTTLAGITPRGREVVERATELVAASGFGLGSLGAADLAALSRVLRRLRKDAGDF